MLGAVRAVSHRVMMSTYNCRQGNRGLKFVLVGLGIVELIIKLLFLLFICLESFVGLL